MYGAFRGVMCQITLVNCPILYYILEIRYRRQEITKYVFTVRHVTAITGTCLYAVNSNTL